MEIPDKLPENLRHFRRMHAFTLQHVADQMDVHHSLISHFESGAKTPSVFRLLQLARLYKVTIDQLLWRR